MGADYRHSHFQNLMAQPPGTIPANSTTYMNPGGGDDVGSASRSDGPLGYAAVIDHLNIRSFAAPGAGETYTWTLMVNNIASALTAQIAGAVATEATDAVNQVAVAADDDICLRIVNSLNAVVTYQRYSMRVRPV